MNQSASPRPSGPLPDEPVGAADAAAGGPGEHAWRAWSPGVRVVVRRRLPAGGDHLYTDVLGELTQVDDAGVTVVTRHGEVRVPGDEITLTKVVPPAPVRRSRPERAEPDA